MRATTYSILAALFSLAPLCETANAGAQARPKYYFPREANRDYGFAVPAEKRAPQADPGTTVVVVPVTVYVGPDGKKYTLGGPTPTPTVDATLPKATGTHEDEDEDPEESPTASPLGGIKLGLPNLFSAPSASISGTQGISLETGGATGFPAQTPSPSPSSSSSSKSGLFDFPDLPGLGTPSPPFGTGRTTATTTSDSTTATETASETETETESNKGPILTLPPLFPTTTSSSSSTDSATDSATDSTGTRSDFTDLTSSSSSTAFPTWELPTLSLPPIFTPTPSPSSSISVTLPPANTTDGGGVTLPPFPTITLPPPETTDPLPTQNSSSTIVIPTPTTTPSGVFPNPTDRPTGWVPSKNSTMVTPTTTSAVQTPPPPPPSSSKEPQKPISTDSLTSMIIPTSIVFQPTPVPPNPSETNKPTALPRIISPDSGIPRAPANSRLIQIGFNSSLSYEFVVSNRDSNVQIFKYVPLGVGYGLQITPDRVTMQSIQPYDILQKRAYTTALALMYIPENLVNELSVAIHNPFSVIYQNPDPSTAQLMAMIDPSIPLIPGGGPIGQEDNPGRGGSGGGDPRRPGNGGGGSEGGEDETEGPGGSGGSSSVKATSVGIGLGVVGGAALYGAAMFFVARRYRKKRKLHRRTSSLTSGMGEIGVVPVAAGAAAAGPMATDALMSGGRSDGYTSPTPYGARDSQSSNGSGSGRNMISAPVMAENSLGWN
ncbi:hypothetical protein GX51_07254 [Blastomyces parvus]|uniref:Uncharacterized protein n=1 Tax=Blastomyces parvus TaxID=2060905 RepID=A0A2B7WM05_9EURO|nr:hypothetical protein GX51_07254 [Blastomyces parvus]